MPDSPSRGRLRRIVQEQAASGDPLGRLAGLLAPNSAAGNDPTVDQHWPDRCSAGLLSPGTAAALLLPGAGPARTLLFLRDLLAHGHDPREVWPAAALCGEPGLAWLETQILDGTQPPGALRALHEAAPERALAVLRERLLIRGLPVRAHDNQPLRALTAAETEQLAERFRKTPTDDWLARNLAWTRSPAAGRTLLDPALLAHPEPLVRIAAVHGLGALLGLDSIPEPERALMALGHADPSSAVRTAALAYLRIRALHSPAAHTLLEDGPGVDEQTTDPELPPISADPEVFTAWLLSRGPGQRLALEQLRSAPALLSQPRDGGVGQRLAEAVAQLAHEALDEGSRGVECIVLLLSILGEPFTADAITALRRPAGPKLSSVAHALAAAAPDRVDVFTALAEHAGGHPDPLLQNHLVDYSLEPSRRVEALVGLLNGLTAPRPAAVRVWITTLDLLVDAVGLNDQDTLARMLPGIGDATRHVLELSRGG